jgi:hypothetical protein
MQPAARVQGQTISAAALAKGKKEYVSKCFNSISSHIGAKSLLWALLSVADPQIRSAPWYRHARAEVLDITVFDKFAAVLAVPREDLEVRFEVEAEEPILPAHPVRHVEIAEDDKLVVCARDGAPEAWGILP